jgi:hypothetical protein
MRARWLAGGFLICLTFAAAAFSQSARPGGTWTVDKK